MTASAPYAESRGDDAPASSGLYALSGAAAQELAPRRSLVGLMAWGVLLALLAASFKSADLRPWDLVRDSG